MSASSRRRRADYSKSLISIYARSRQLLDLAEIEFSTLSEQCLVRRIPDTGLLSQEVAAWVDWRNRAGSRVNWLFTADDTRAKFRKLYPLFEALLSTR